jgi:hypothetical protein
VLTVAVPAGYALRICRLAVPSWSRFWSLYGARHRDPDPIYLAASRLGVLDTHGVLILLYSTFLQSWLLRGFFTDRDGKFQLAALAESGFDPLARTCRFMLTEEAHHMFVGDTGVGRIVSRTADVMATHKIENPDQVRDLGVIDLPTIQRYLNFHYSVTLDLFGSDMSSNAANFFASGLKGRYRETALHDDHVLTDATYAVCEVVDGRLIDLRSRQQTAIHPRLELVLEFLRERVVGRGRHRALRDLAVDDVGVQLDVLVACEIQTPRHRVAIERSCQGRLDVLFKRD